MAKANSPAPDVLADDELKHLLKGPPCASTRRPRRHSTGTKRIRARHPYASLPWLWIGFRGRMTRKGVPTMLNKRAAEAGVRHVHPHQLRHTWADRWLSAGGNEGDRQRLGGWESAEIMRRYGEARAVDRALTAYDAVNPTEGCRRKRRQRPAARLRARRAFADFIASPAKYAFFAASALRSRSGIGSVPWVSTCRSNVAKNASRSFLVVARQSWVACIVYPAIRARTLR